MKRAIGGLTAIYILAVAIIMFWFGDTDLRLRGVAIGEALFSLPIIAAWLISLFLRRPSSRQIMLAFDLAYYLFSANMLFKIFTEEHDAQWQLAFLVIPMFGFPALVFAALCVAITELTRLRTR